LEEQTRRRFHASVTIGVLLGFVGALVFASGNRLSLPVPAFWVAVGLALAWSGMLLRLWAVLALGRAFTLTVVVRP
jgi:protein-S-isoprenylcysteine O-methyltransferase Ste14